MADSARISNQMCQGAEVVVVRQASLAQCRDAEQDMLKSLAAWETRPARKLVLGGDTECFIDGVPVGELTSWFRPGVRSKKVTSNFV